MHKKRKIFTQIFQSRVHTFCKVNFWYKRLFKFTALKIHRGISLSNKVLLNLDSEKQFYSWDHDFRFKSYV